MRVDLFDFELPAERIALLRRLHDAVLARSGDLVVLGFVRELPDPTKAIVTTRHRIDVAYPVRLLGMPQADALPTGWFLAWQTSAKRLIKELEVDASVWILNLVILAAVLFAVELVATASAAVTTARAVLWR